ncbi:MAG TPA: hypothetical protein PLB01_04290 [Thermoanaerobaculia bacterium]|nr:hypothetical protein [Thermoanaerobaculia bacterium]
MKSLVSMTSKVLGIAIAITILGAGPANGEYFQGCMRCGPTGCVNVADQRFGGEGCQSYYGMNAGNFGIVCNESPSICYRDSISITVTGSSLDNNINCDIWSWLMGWC